jgi:hypothetical protein
MKKGFCILLTASILLFVSTVFASPDEEREPPTAKDYLRHSGIVMGAVVCPDGGPASGAMVYIKGLSFVAITDDGGEFALLYVPEGAWVLAVRVGDQVAAEIPVRVRKKRRIDLGEIGGPLRGASLRGECPV